MVIYTDDNTNIYDIEGNGYGFGSGSGRGSVFGENGIEYDTSGTISGYGYGWGLGDGDGTLLGVGKSHRNGINNFNIQD